LKTLRKQQWNWLSRSWLRVVDLADPDNLMPWAPVEISGQLIGVPRFERAGGLIFARSGAQAQNVAALGFDGERAWLVSELTLDQAGTAVAGGSVIFASIRDGVGRWDFDESAARWMPAPGWTLGESPGELAVMDGALLASAYGKAWLLDADGSFRFVEAAHTDVAGAAQTGGTFLVPCGQLGVLKLTRAP
jgi:hypothetical protein